MNPSDGWTRDAEPFGAGHRHSVRESKNDDFGVQLDALTCVIIWRIPEACCRAAKAICVEFGTASRTGGYPRYDLNLQRTPFEI